jgi:hypothetical protein
MNSILKVKRANEQAPAIDVTLLAGLQFGFTGVAGSGGSFRQNNYRVNLR